MMVLNLIFAGVLLRGDVTAFEKGDYEKILKEYKNSILYYDAILKYSRSLFENKKYRKALRILESYKNEFPEYLVPQVMELKKEIYKELGYEGYYKKLLKKILKDYPLLLNEKELKVIKNFEFYKGRYYFLKRDWEKAISHFKSSKRRLKYYYIGYSYFKLGKYEKALSYLDNLLPSHGRWYYEKAKILKGLCYKYKDEIENSIKEFLRVSPEYLRLRENALKEARLVMLENNFYPRETVIKLPPVEKLLVDYDMNLLSKSRFNRKFLEKEINIFVLKLLGEYTGKDVFFEKIKKIEPLSLFSLRKSGICYEEDIISSEEEKEDLIILAYFEMEDAFKYYIEKVNDFELLISTAEKLQKIGKWFYSVYTAKKAYTLLRTEDHTICFPLTLLKLLFPLPYKEIVFEKSREKNINPYLIYAIMRRESMFNEKAVSPRGAIGLMQIMPEAFKKIRKYKNFASDSLKNPFINIDAGIEIFSSLLDSLGEIYLAVAAYNAGVARLKDWKGKGVIKNEFQFLMDCPFEETRKYTFRVLSDYEAYKKLYYE